VSRHSTVVNLMGDVPGIETVEHTTARMDLVFLPLSEVGTGVALGAVGGVALGGVALGDLGLGRLGVARGYCVAGTCGHAGCTVAGRRVCTLGDVLGAAAVAVGVALGTAAAVIAVGAAVVAVGAAVAVAVGVAAAVPQHPEDVGEREREDEEGGGEVLGGGDHQIRTE